MKVIDLLNKIANGEVPKKIKIDNKFTYIHDGIDYKNHDGTYLFDSYLETTTEDMNIKVEILEEPKRIPEKLYEINNIGDLTITYPSNKELMNKINEIIEYLEYLESKGE